MADRNTVSRETVELGTVEGDLNVERGTIDTVDGTLKVNGVIRCIGDCEFNGNVKLRQFSRRKAMSTSRGQSRQKRLRSGTVASG